VVVEGGRGRGGSISQRHRGGGGAGCELKNCREAQHLFFHRLFILRQISSIRWYRLFKVYLVARATRWRGHSHPGTVLLYPFSSPFFMLDKHRRRAALRQADASRETAGMRAASSMAMLEVLLAALVVPSDMVGRVSMMAGRNASSRSATRAGDAPLPSTRRQL
jgi:hypothetical protein